MQFSEIQQGVIKNAEAYGKEHDVEINASFSQMKLVEELGEFAQAVMISKHQCRKEKIVDDATALDAIAQELADVVGMAMLNAHYLGIDLEDAITKKWLRNTT